MRDLPRRALGVLVVGFWILVVSSIGVGFGTLMAATTIGGILWW
jgi:hypothetical protein